MPIGAPYDFTGDAIEARYELARLACEITCVTPAQLDAIRVATSDGRFGWRPLQRDHTKALAEQTNLPPGPMLEQPSTGTVGGNAPSVGENPCFLSPGLSLIGQFGPLAEVTRALQEACKNNFLGGAAKALVCSWAQRYDPGESLFGGVVYRMAMYWCGTPAPHAMGGGSEGAPVRLPPVDLSGRTVTPPPFQLPPAMGVNSPIPVGASGTKDVDSPSGQLLSQAVGARSAVDLFTACLQTPTGAQTMAAVLSRILTGRDDDLDAAAAALATEVLMRGNAKEAAFVLAPDAEVGAKAMEKAPDAALPLPTRKALVAILSQGVHQ